jgi:hypothetical protein
MGIVMTPGIASGVSEIPVTYTLYSPGGMPSFSFTEDNLYVPPSNISPLEMKPSFEKITMPPAGTGELSSDHVTFPVSFLFPLHPMAKRQINKQIKNEYFFIESPFVGKNG